MQREDPRICEERGEPKRALHYYREGLRFAPHDPRAQARLAALEGSGERHRKELPGPHGVVFASADDRATRPLWSPASLPPRLRRCGIDSSLEPLDRTKAIIVSVGDVPVHFVDVVGAVIWRELELPACSTPNPVTLPPHSRIHGRRFGRQWTAKSLVDAFADQTHPPLGTPAKYVLLTPATIYSGRTHFVYSTTYHWGALVSFGMFGDATTETSRVVERLAKQTLGALTKSFGVPSSADPRCVTSYVNGLEQFDRKGNRPNAESFAILKRELQRQNSRWRASRRPHSARSEARITPEM